MNLFLRIPILLLSLLLVNSACQQVQKTAQITGEAIQKDEMETFNKQFAPSGWATGDYLKTEEGFESFRELFEGLQLHLGEIQQFAAKDDFEGITRELYKEYSFYRVQVLGTVGKKRVEVAEMIIYTQQTAENVSIFDGPADGTWIKTIFLSELGLNALGQPSPSVLGIPEHLIIERINKVDLINMGIPSTKAETLLQLLKSAK